MTGPPLDPTLAAPLVPLLSGVLIGLTVAYLALLGFALRGVLRPAPPTPAPPRSRPYPSVSVVVPARNEERRLPTLLASLRAQRYDGPVEFVLVDDRSSDRTGALIARAATDDARVIRVRIDRPHPRRAPKVHAVARGIDASRGEIVLATDADCLHPPGWIATMVRHLEPDRTMVVGYVEVTRRGRIGSLLQRLETIDWLALMLVSRSLVRAGFPFASSANNQGYRRTAFEAAGGFGATQRAPSGDEDLLAQRLARLPGAKIVFADDPNARVRTEPSPSWWALVQQRRRWVSRYHHAVHYRPAFLGSVGVMAAQSVALVVAIAALPWVPAAAPVVASLFAAQIALQTFGVARGARQLGRDDLIGPALLAWAVLHPFFVATVTVLSSLRSGEWRAGAAPYRRRWWRRRVRNARRALFGPRSRAGGAHVRRVGAAPDGAGARRPTDGGRGNAR